MVNYQNGKIYLIEPIVDSEEGDIYIGSTTKQYLSQRMDTHRNKYNQWKNDKSRFVTSYTLFDKYGVENCQIILLENCPVNTKDELFLRERHYIKTMKCVNKISPIFTKEDKRISDKKYRESHLEQLKEKKNEKFQCPCGGSYTHCHKALHFRTKKHIKYIKENEIKKSNEPISI